MGVVGAGRGAVLHAEAVRAAAGLQLAGVAAQSPTSPRAVALAAALDCEVLELAELARRCDVAVIATPPDVHPLVACELAASGRVRAVLVESPAAATIDDLDRLQDAMGSLPTMVAVNLLHAPAMRQFLTTVASMHPHHLELRLRVPTPAGVSENAQQVGGTIKAHQPPCVPNGVSENAQQVGKQKGPEQHIGVHPRTMPGTTGHFGGGVLMNPTAGFWPVLLAALNAAVASVSTSWLDLRDGLVHAAQVVLRAQNGRVARADLRWGAEVAEASLEVADADHVARIEIWPTPTLEIDGTASPLPGEQHPLARLGFTQQISRLARVAQGEAEPWPDLSFGAAAVRVAVAATTAHLHNSEVMTSAVATNMSPQAILNTKIT